MITALTNWIRENIEPHMPLDGTCREVAEETVELGRLSIDDEIGCVWITIDQPFASDIDVPIFGDMAEQLTYWLLTQTDLAMASY